MNIYGIDQTGAVLNKTQAKPLKACQLVLNTKDQIQDINFFDIPHLAHWTQTLSSDQPHHIFIDCVLGLPLELYQTNSSMALRDWIRKAGKFSLDTKNYGRQVSQAFFDQILEFYNFKGQDLPKRRVEFELNSNSVFTTYPFQKNIQTGTFRIWKELCPCLDNVLLWPTDFYLKNELNTIFYEVYPSYFYKKILKVKVRSASPVLKYLEKQNLKITNKVKSHINNPDSCDALMAALGGHYCIVNEKIWDQMSEDIFFEGDILGSNY